MIELMIALLIMAITAGAFSLSLDIWTITAKREAERLFAKLSNLMLKADMTQTHFQLEVDSEKIRVQWNSEYTNLVKKKYLFVENITASKGCSYSWNAPSDILYYSYITNRYSQGTTITVTGRGKPYYVIIAAVGSRVRISDSKPSK